MIRKHRGTAAAVLGAASIVTASAVASAEGETDPAIYARLGGRDLRPGRYAWWVWPPRSPVSCWQVCYGRRIWERLRAQCAGVSCRLRIPSECSESVVAG
jgi:hypothetical protein